MNKLYRSLLICFLLVSCQPTDIPVQYNTMVKDIQKNPYGAWALVELNTTAAPTGKLNMAGELISIAVDSVFLLTGDTNLAIVPSMQINRITLYTHKNQAGTYGTIMGILLLPNIIGAMANDSEYAGSLLLLGVPAFLTGMTVVLIEASGKGNQLVYPEKNTLYDLQKYCRFPQGIPVNVNRNQLTLKSP